MSGIVLNTLHALLHLIITSLYDEVGATIIPTLEIKKLRLTKV